MTKITKSSGNIFEDLGFEQPAEELAKADLAIKIYEIIKERKLKQREAAKILEIDQPKVSALINGRLKDFSINRLLRFLTLLDQNIKIVIGDKKKMVSNRPISVVEVNP
jgi:predicted XRE-type DNA-binding protein